MKSAFRLAGPGHLFDRDDNVQHRSKESLTAVRKTLGFIASALEECQRTAHWAYLFPRHPSRNCRQRFPYACGILPLGFDASTTNPKWRHQA